MTFRLTRRNLLRRAPVAPFAVGAAVTQVPALLQNQMPMAERIRWFVYTIQSIEKPLEGKPNFNGQAMNEFVAQTVRWESYLEQLRGTAVWAGVPLEKAAELVGHALR